MRSIVVVRWFLMAGGALGLVGRLVTGQIAYTRLMYVCLLVLIASYLWSLVSLKGIQLTREARVLRASVGEVFEEHFEVSTTSLFGCLWLEVVNQSNLPLGSGSRLLTGIAAKQKRFYSARTLLTKRGAYLLGPTFLSSGDPFGLFPTHKIIAGTETLVILPMTVNIPTFPPPPGLLPGGKAIRQKTMDVTPHAAGIREYVPGDPMKRIHWKSTARRGRFMVKEFEQDPQSDIWIFLDAQLSKHYKSLQAPAQSYSDGFLLRRPKVELPCETFEYAISAAASLARFFLVEKRSVGLVCASRHLTVLSAERGERQLGKVLETMAFLQPTGELPLMGLVEMQAKLLPLGTGVILVTTSAGPELINAVADLQRRKLVPFIVHINGASFGGPMSSNIAETNLINLNIPICKIAFGDDLGQKLSLPAVYYQTHYIPRGAYYS